MITLVQQLDIIEAVLLEVLRVRKLAKSHTPPGMLPQTTQFQKQPTKLEIPVPLTKIFVATQPITSVAE
ncbi:MAG: hypothetical protein COV41_02460 [Candidatus Brennerbacteria bacterium CG11_big_fil_rev_8_21_14_0_20_43_10]|uniref:Uncharacterized protein n=1 Tax=Candidatus Brennerbacteria bacterium CG11_big_fil_rev_8_21_14_0_20_43_10 TaxID=1974523 RepID=A0A2H0PV58_9BACT|nr:MAG: hypothetical protein COV41_02460 [Candidatus Brennerbacteria bacterium CG11_big_fil_rev_8_21_14_0_20_43_10]